MPAKVTLEVIQGKLQAQEFVFGERTTCIVGRAKDCQPRLPNDADHKDISRHHCLLDINPPDVRVRDFGSLNGTSVNGETIGQREKGMTPEEGARLKLPEYDLKDGDTIELGDTTFQVHVFVPVVCAECDREIPEERKSQCERMPGVYQCETCHEKADATQRREPLRNKARVCAQCGRDVSREMSANRHGDFICAKCQTDPFQVLKHLLELAQSGGQEVLAIRGYKVLKELGKGGMGAVYLARHEKSGEQVALKVMLPKVGVSAQARERFLREVENTRALRHPNVAQLRDAGCSQGTFFFTLEYCDGGSVDKLLVQRGGSLSIADAVGIVLQALAGLEYAHQVEVPRVKLADGSYSSGRGLVHRDLKPHNLFLSGSGTGRIAKIGDFGLAKAFDLAGMTGQSCTGTAAGTPVFMPRQQVVNFKYARPDVDVWATAASLYYMLTGAVPRDFARGEDPWRVVLQTSAVPIRQRDPKIPKRLAEVIDLALVDQPEIHFKTAVELRRALESVL